MSPEPNFELFKPFRRRNNYGNSSRGGNRGGGNFNRKFTTAANSIPLGPRKMPGDINKGAE